MKASLLRPLGLALALAVALTTGGVREAVGVATPPNELLSAELPAGLTIVASPTLVLATALRSAIRKNSDVAVSLLRVALLSRKHASRKKVTRDIICEDFAILTRAALEAAPGQARALIEQATLLAPECADEFYRLIGGDASGGSLPAFGTGYVLPGFAGAPGFSGSNPGGGIFDPVTPTTNR